MSDTIRHLSMPSPLGPLTLFADGDTLIVLEAGKAPGLGAVDPLLLEAKHQLNAYFDGRLKSFDLPLAPPGTKRRQDIWAEMARVPYGATKTYGDIAKTLSSAARAVGGACANNPLPIFIPCHRILGAGGGVGHYSFADGQETKRRLLILEGIDI